MVRSRVPVRPYGDSCEDIQRRESPPGVVYDFAKRYGLSSLFSLGRVFGGGRERVVLCGGAGWTRQSASVFPLSQTQTCTSPRFPLCYVENLSWSEKDTIRLYTQNLVPYSTLPC